MYAQVYNPKVGDIVSPKHVRLQVHNIEVGDSISPKLIHLKVYNTEGGDSRFLRNLSTYLSTQR
jgi:hypothetical protein